MRIVVLLALALSALTMSGPTVAQVDRCAAAEVMLADREALVEAEIAYFTSILESAQCSDGQTQVVTANPETPAPVQEAMPDPEPVEMASRSQAPAAVEPIEPEPILPVGEYSATQCRDALKTLTRQSDDKAGSDEEMALIQVTTSQDCRALRAQRARQMSADPGIAAMMQTLRDGGIDVEARMPAQVERCRAKVDGEIAAGATEERQRMVDGCIAVARQMVYSAAINELNENANAAYEREMEAHRAELARLEAERQEKARKEAAEKAAYEKEMAEWRRKVKLCNEGKREYCHNE